MEYTPYEISLWKDELDQITGKYKEVKVATIGTESMDAMNAAYDPVFTTNINGTNTFSFKIYISYLDIDGVLKPNPFANMLTNEQKIKVKWHGKWYNFIIKDVVEDSEEKSITYACEDLCIAELSKTGFNLEFSTDLENNQGTVGELAEKVLEGSDWVYDDDATDLIQQLTEDAVYEVKTKRQITAENQTQNILSSTIPSGKTVLIYYSQIQDLIDAGTSVTTEIQFAYATKYLTDVNKMLVTNADCYKINLTFSRSGDTITLKSGSNTVFEFNRRNLSSRYRAKFVFSSAKTVYDKLSKHYVQIYKANQTPGSSSEYYGSFTNGDEIYRYVETITNTPDTITNVFLNSENFSSFDGWTINNVRGNPSMAFEVFPSYSNFALSNLSFDDFNPKGFFKLYAGSNSSFTYNATYDNNGLKNMIQYLPSNGIKKGDEYIFRYKVRSKTLGADNVPSEIAHVLPNTATSTQHGAKINLKCMNETHTTTYFDTTSVSETYSDGWHTIRVKCKKSFTLEDIIDNGIHLNISWLSNGGDNDYRWLESIQFYQYLEVTKYVYNEQSETYTKQTVAASPDDLSTTALAIQVINYYNHTSTSAAGISDFNKVKMIYSGANEDQELSGMIVKEPVENFEAIRTIEAKESNRFNLLQNLAELFQCWCQFTVNCNSYGVIQSKKVSFKREVGQETNISFIYGIDLESVQRTIQSSDIVTKTIVAPNSNELAQDGSCMISRSNNNIPKVNYLLNFDYYIAQGMLDGDQLRVDLYSKENYDGFTGAKARLNGHPKGYFYALQYLNTSYDQNEFALQNLKTELEKQQSYLQMYKDAVSSAKEIKQAKQAEIYQLSGLSTKSTEAQFAKAVKKYIKNNGDQSNIIDLFQGWLLAKQSLTSYNVQVTDLTKSIKAINAEIKSYKKVSSEFLTCIKYVDKQFNTKYSRFIFEGVWSSEDYIDDNLYYIDAQQVAYDSSRPQISYSINVKRTDYIPGFENRVFNLGDIAFIEDVEFFGYTDATKQTPVKEQIIITEIQYHFRDPSQDTITVQNYRSQFDDLFQRITAQVQSLTFSQGSYARAAAQLNTNGTLKADTLQQSIQQNQALVLGSNAQGITVDSTGILVSNKSYPNEMTKITSGGVFISNDAGLTWKSAINSRGISTEYLSAGAIDTGAITITQGTSPTFRWDANGITAYSHWIEQTGDNETEEVVSLNKFVRFDQYGLYGIDSIVADAFRPASEQQIWDTAKFGITWKGFFLNTKRYYTYTDISGDEVKTYDAGFIELSDENDFTLWVDVDGEKIDRIKLGQIGIAEVADKDGQLIQQPLYGMRLKDNDNQVTLEANDEGELWLRSALYIEGSTKSNQGTGQDTNNDQYAIMLGRLPGTKESSEETSDALIHEIINVNGGNFIVYENGDVIAKNGTFSGDIDARSGNFTGTINSNGGQIGGWVIGEDGLYSLSYEEVGINKTQFDDNKLLYYYFNDGQYIQCTEDSEYDSSTKYYVQYTNISLNSSGSISADNLTLGKNAQIKNSVQIGDDTGYVSYIYNPSINENGLIFETRHITATDNYNLLSFDKTGLLKLGRDSNQIVLDGEQSVIYGNRFMISPDMASFSNVDVSGKIMTSVFEVNQIQAVGGSMIFKPSYKILEHTALDCYCKVVVTENEFDSGKGDGKYYTKNTDDTFTQSNATSTYDALAQYYILTQQLAIKLDTTDNINNIITKQGIYCYLAHTNQKISVGENVQVSTLGSNYEPVRAFTDLNQLWPRGIECPSLDPGSNYIYIFGNDGQAEHLNQNTVALDLDYITLIILGKNEDISIGINSGDNGTDSSDLLLHRSITIAELKTNQDYEQCTDESVFNVLENYYEVVYNQVAITENEFNNNKTNYYYEDGDDNYIRCTIDSVFSTGTTYYTMAYSYVPVTESAFNENKSHYFVSNLLRIDLDTTVKSFLGDFTGINPSGFGALQPSGYGLYCDNVYLKGSLIAASADEYGNDIYAGINTNSSIMNTNSDLFYWERDLTESIFNLNKTNYYTLNDITGNYIQCTPSSQFDASTKYYLPDHTPIIIWGGARSVRNYNVNGQVNGESEWGITASPFFITQAGNLYANSGRFEGAIITDSIIKSAALYTAHIYGTNDNRPSLTIEGTQGIQFLHAQSESVVAESFNIGLNGLYITKGDATFDIISLVGSGSNFAPQIHEDENLKIGINADGVYAHQSWGAELHTVSTSDTVRLIGTDETLKIIGNCLFGDNSNHTITDGSKLAISSLDEGPNFRFSNGGSGIMEMTSSETKILSESVSCEDELLLGDKLQFKKHYTSGSLTGYDIYVL